MEHVTFDEFFDFVKNEDADWYIPGLKEYFEGLNQDEIYIQDNFLGKLVFQFNKFENNLKKKGIDTSFLDIYRIKLSKCLAA